ncbi:Kynurenine formamidase [Orchesella cincta]|uniref:Kynurenine formamidase n=1 Tax=Orchesella cincta TaxID=48709 RepID=A0A1D2MDG3_ORCCI|nr:Kynurenine formamidase [Orchesella cincta]
MKKFVALVWFSFILASVAVRSTKASEYFDLSYSLNNDTIFYPGQKFNFELYKDRKGYTEGGYWYATYSFCMAEHGGTHVDAPIHFNENGWTLDEIPDSHMIDVRAAIIDVQEDVFSSPSPDAFTLQVQHILKHESQHGKIPSKSVVLVHTGWSRFWPDKQTYLGWTNSTNSSKPILNFPGCSGEAAKWLANERNIVGFGIDTPSVDIGNNGGNLPVHVFFGERQIYNIENVANLHLVLNAVNKKGKLCDGFSSNLRLFVLPIKITGATGGPARILAYC